MSLSHIARGLFALTLAIGMSSAEAGVRIHYAPAENLEHIDVGELDRATNSIDFAAFILSDRPVIDALVRAHTRGVAVRLVLDPSQKHDDERLAPLADVTRKKKRGALMHLKSWAIDGRLLRTGSANFTASGLKRQDNDLLLIDDAGAVGAFLADFERMWNSAAPER